MNRTTRSAGNLVQNVFKPSGAAISKDVNIPEVLQTKVATKFMKMMRSSGTPCSFRTSTAFMADPPVANPG
jgi:hypothetical protein